MKTSGVLIASIKRQQWLAKCRSENQQLAVVLGGKIGNKSCCVFALLGSTIIQLLHYPINHATLCTQVGIALILLKMLRKSLNLALLAKAYLILC